MSILPHPASLPIEKLLGDCSIKRTRASGPGGQHRNKVETAIVITHSPTGVIGKASEKRSQNENRKVAVVRIRINLALAIRTEMETDPVPSDRWLSRVRGGKIGVSVNHEIYPGLLAEALDVIVYRSFDMSAAAEDLNVSSSQLVKFLKTTPASFEMVNRHRKEIGLRKLG